MGAHCQDLLLRTTTYAQMGRNLLVSVHPGPSWYSRRSRVPSCRSLETLLEDAWLIDGLLWWWCSLSPSLMSAPLYAKRTTNPSQRLDPSQLVFAEHPPTSHSINLDLYVPYLKTIQLVPKWLWLELINGNYYWKSLLNSYWKSMEVGPGGSWAVSLRFPY